jgi:hypothetical protein
MLESLYNRPRCKALTSDEDGAIQDLKKELYPKVKPSFDSIKTTRTDFQGSYSSNLTQLINKHLPNTFTEDTPPFDMLEASIYSPDLGKEQKDYVAIATVKWAVFSPKNANPAVRHNDFCLENRITRACRVYATPFIELVVWWLLTTKPPLLLLYLKP